MNVKLKLLGATNRPVDIGDDVRIPNWHYLYFAEAENGLVDVIEDEDYVEDGIYDLPNFTTEKEDSEDEDDLLGSSATRQSGSGTKREICETAAFLWT